MWGHRKVDKSKKKKGSYEKENNCKKNRPFQKSQNSKTKKCPQVDSNSQPDDSESSALPFRPTAMLTSGYYN